MGGTTRQFQPQGPSGGAVPSMSLASSPSMPPTRQGKLAARRSRHRPCGCPAWVSRWLGSPWGRALGGTTRHFQPQRLWARGASALFPSPPTQRRPAAAPQQSARLARQCSAPKSQGRFLCPRPCYLRLRARWASGEAELRPWARIRECCIVAFDAHGDKRKLDGMARRSYHRPVGCAP